MKTIEQVLAAFETAALNAGLARNTRSTYASTIAEFAAMMKRGETEIYLHTAGKKSVASPLDSEAARNIIPLRRTA